MSRTGWKLPCSRWLFLGVERLFWQLPGVYSTAAAGYTGGYTPNPTYREVCTGDTGHAEAVRIVYDPQVISYAQLLQVFWENHDPAQGMQQGNDHGTQYRSAIYPLTPEQDEAARRPVWHVSRPQCATPTTPAQLHGNCSGEAVLLRRGRSSAVPAQKSVRLLRYRRHWRLSAPQA